MKDKRSASKDIAEYLQTRKGKRPIRVHNLLKKASDSGQDLRLPVMGGTKFPTSDSLASAKSKLQASQNSAEVGPSPTLKSLSPKGQTIAQKVPVSPGSINLMPKVGNDMSFKNDPLVQYLSQQYHEKLSEILGTNQSRVIEQDCRPPLQFEEDPDLLPPDLEASSKEEWTDYLRKTFKHTDFRCKKEIFAKMPKS